MILTELLFSALLNGFVLHDLYRILAKPSLDHFVDTGRSEGLFVLVLQHEVEELWVALEEAVLLSDGHSNDTVLDLVVNDLLVFV